MSSNKAPDKACQEKMNKDFIQQCIPLCFLMLQEYIH